GGTGDRRTRRVLPGDAESVAGCTDDGGRLTHRGGESLREDRAPESERRVRPPGHRPERASRTSGAIVSAAETTARGYIARAANTGHDHSHRSGRHAVARTDRRGIPDCTGGHSFRSHASHRP